MKRITAATAVILTILSEPAFAQTEQPPQKDSNVEASTIVSQQYTRGVNAFLVQREYNSAHSERAQKIFDRLRAEKGNGTAR